MSRTLFKSNLNKFKRINLVSLGYVFLFYEISLLIGLLLKLLLNVVFKCTKIQKFVFVRGLVIQILNFIDYKLIIGV